MYRKIADFSGSSISISTGSSTITNSFTVTPGVSGIPAFPSSGARTADLLVLATDANGYSVAFIVPQFTINP